jgi:hypothetical protein
MADVIPVLASAAAYYCKNYHDIFKLMSSQYGLTCNIMFKAQNSLCKVANVPYSHADLHGSQMNVIQVNLFFTWRSKDSKLHGLLNLKTKTIHQHVDMDQLRANILPFI